MSKSLINPFELLGINEKSRLKDARKSYYQLALLCHPDCGGHEDSMKILVNAYAFVEKQLKIKNDISGDWDKKGKELEEEFDEFNKNIKAEIPRMTDLYDLADMQQKREAKSRNFQVYNEKFNKEFEEEEKYQFEELFGNNAFEGGYGHLMDKDKDYETDDEYIVPPKHKFKGEIQIYKEPHILPDTYGSNFRYDVKEVKDYSNYEKNEFDYVKAHSELENEPMEIESVKDNPMINLEEMVEKRKEERENLTVEYSQIDLVLKTVEDNFELVNFNQE
jgi:curved DNA-binding protein CbpA